MEIISLSVDEETLNKIEEIQQKVPLTADLSYCGRLLKTFTTRLQTTII